MGRPPAGELGQKGARSRLANWDEDSIVESASGPMCYVGYISPQPNT